MFWLGDSLLGKALTFGGGFDQLGVAIEILVCRFHLGLRPSIDSSRDGTCLGSTLHIRAIILVDIACIFITTIGRHQIRFLASHFIVFSCKSVSLYQSLVLRKSEISPYLGLLTAYCNGS